MKILIYSFFLFLVAPCNGTKKVAATAGGDRDLSKVVIVYECTPCFGRCPVYTMTISGATKMATYVGKSGTEKTGTYTKPVTDKELQHLVDEFDKAEFKTLNEKYAGNISDFPFRNTTYTYDGLSKKVMDRSGGPEKLQALEKALQAFADSEGWKKEDGDQ